MKATGIVRRVDDLGRIVIPKEIRRTLKIREGDPLEIYTSVPSSAASDVYKRQRYMKATGIVRRVDDLGRIVIPKEIRRTLKIRAVSYTHLRAHETQ